MRFCGRRSGGRRRRCRCGVIFRSSYDRKVQTRAVIEVSGTFCVDDLARSKYLGVLGGSRRLTWIVAMAMLVSVLFFAFEASNPDFPGNAVLRNAVQLALFLLIFIYLIAVMTYRDSRKELGGRLYYRDPVTYVFTGETVSITGTGLSSSITWKNIARIRETRSLF